jgi:predicted regulator of Ras-like GTPase activity (Roadblock/LC7/MglB family)
VPYLIAAVGVLALLVAVIVDLRSRPSRPAAAPEPRPLAPEPPTGEAAAPQATAAEPQPGPDQAAAPPPRPALPTAAPPPWPAAAADLLRALGRMPGVRGWAIVGAEGAVVAAEAVLRGGFVVGGHDLTEAAAHVARDLGLGAWQTAEIRTPAGSLQAVAGPRGWSLLVLLGPEADGERVRAEGGRILASLGE